MYHSKSVIDNYVIILTFQRCDTGIPMNHYYAAPMHVIVKRVIKMRLSGALDQHHCMGRMFPQHNYIVYQCNLACICILSKHSSSDHLATVIISLLKYII